MNTKKQKIQWTTLLPWFMWSMAALFYFYKNLLEVSPSVMSSEWMSTFAINATSLGNLAASYFYAYLLMQIPMGILLDRYGPRIVGTFSIFLCALGTLIVAWADTTNVAIVGRLITGVGAAVAAVNCLKIITLWFPAQRFALMMGLMMTLGMIGAVFGQAPLSVFVDTLGWRDTLMYVSFIGIAFTVVFWMFVRDAGKVNVTLTPTLSTFKQPPFWAGLVEILKKKQTWLLSLYSGFAFAPIMVFGGLWGVPYLQAAHQFSKIEAASAVSLIFIGFAIGSPILGWLSDTLGRRWPVMAWGTVGAFISILIAMYCPGISVMAASTFLFLFGFFISGFLLCFSMIREINRLAVAATAMGFMNAFDAALGGISDPFIGKLLDMGWQGEMVNGARVFSLSDYYISMSIIPIYLGLALILVFTLKETYCKQHDNDMTSDERPADLNPISIQQT